MLCTIKDAKPMSTYDIDLPEPPDCLMVYLRSLDDGEWHSMGDLRKAGYDHFSWFAELHLRGLAEGITAPHRMRREVAIGSRFWFRITDAGREALVAWSDVPF